MSVTSLDRDKLAKLLGMLGSDHVGEIAAAARQAERVRREAGLTWHEILAPFPVVVVGDDRDAAVDELLASADALTDWELNFAVSIRSTRRDLTEKQRAVLERLLRKVRSAARAAA